MDNYQLTPRVPTPDEYLHLRAAAGPSPFSRAAAELALPNTIFAVVIEEAGRAIGMGRLISDGGCFFQIVDIAVDPTHQGRGLGKRIMAGLMAHVATLPKGAYVSLIADTPADRLYAQFGFVATAPRSLGMAYRVK